MSAGPAWVEALLAPRGVALVGASADPSKVSGRALAYLLRYGFAGGVYPVNPRRPVVQGVRAYPSVADVPQRVDLAVISVPARTAAQAVRACAARGIPLAIVYASGFAEVGAEGARNQQELRAIATQTGMRILGPNCLGSISFPNRVTTTFTSALDQGVLQVGPIALITQSGAFASFVFSTGQRAGLGFHCLANTGNEADLTLSDLLEALVELPEVGVVLSHIEGIRDEPGFERAACRARELGKPIVAVKVGRTAVGAAAARAHTGSDVGVEAHYDELFRRCGIHRVESMEALVDAAQIFSSPKVPRGNRACIVTISGGAGVLMADACAIAGLEVPELSAALRRELADALPWFGSTRNPVDLTGSVLDDLALFASTLDLCGADPGTDLLLIAIGNVTVGEEELTHSILGVASRYDKPVVVSWVGGSGHPARQLTEARVPVYTDPCRAVRAASLLVRHHRSTRREAGRDGLPQPFEAGRHP